MVLDGEFGDVCRGEMQLRLEILIVSGWVRATIGLAPWACSGLGRGRFVGTRTRVVGDPAGVIGEVSPEGAVGQPEAASERDHRRTWASVVRVSGELGPGAADLVVGWQVHWASHGAAAG